MKILSTLSLLTALVAFSTQAQSLVITEIFYNTPGAGNDTIEYVEIFNNGSAAVDLQNYQLATAVVFTFPQQMLQPDSFLLVSKFSNYTLQYLNKTSLQWTSGSLNNAGERIDLVDPNGNLVDTVHYYPTAPWDTIADGHGYALVLCDPNADNADPANWTTPHNYMGFLVDSLFGNPGRGCQTEITDTLHTAFEKPAASSRPFNVIGNAITMRNTSASDEIEVYDLLGNRCVVASAASKSIQLPILPNGMYIIQMRRHGQVIDTQRLVIRR